MTQELPLIEWSFVLTLLQLNQYLTNPELTTLSLTNKHLRAKLKPYVFTSIFPSNFFNSKLIQNYGDFYISKEALNYNINQEFEAIKGFVKSIKLTYKSNPIYNNSLIDYFKPITSIYFMGLIIQGDQLNFIFNSLSNLESLKLKDNEVLIYQSSNYDQSIQLPQSLKKLNLKNNSTHFTNQFIEGMSFIQATSHFTDFSPSIVLEKEQKYPNLMELKFHYESSQSGLVLEDLLINNTQLNRIKISGHLVTPNLFKLLSSYPSHCQVCFKPNYSSIDDIPTDINYEFSRVTQLNLKLLKNLPENLVNCIIEPFLNYTTKLTLSYSMDLASLYNSIIERFINVKELILIGYGKFDTIEKLKVGKNVRYLELQNYSIINDCGILNNLYNNPDLKKIKVSTNNKLNKLVLSEDFIEFYENNINNIRIVEFLDSKVIYRV